MMDSWSDWDETEQNAEGLNWACWEDESDRY